MKVFELSRVSCAWIEAPFGPVFVAKTRKGVCRVSFRRSEDELLSDLERRSLLPRWRRKLRSGAAQLDEYFQGSAAGFDFPRSPVGH
jgi:O6-methylguanine-DNA--protein-cysteine methyltransferase